MHICVYHTTELGQLQSNRVCFERHSDCKSSPSTFASPFSPPSLEFCAVAQTCPLCLVLLGVLIGLLECQQSPETEEERGDFEAHAEREEVHCHLAVVVHPTGATPFTILLPDYARLIYETAECHWSRYGTLRKKRIYCRAKDILQIQRWGLGRRLASQRKCHIIDAKLSFFK